MSRVHRCTTGVWLQRNDHFIRILGARPEGSPCTRLVRLPVYLETNQAMLACGEPGWPVVRATNQTLRYPAEPSL